MKRTYPFSLVLALTTICAGQNPTVAAKSTSADSAAKPTPQVTSVSAKPSPATVKVVPVGGQKTASVQVKPAAVPVQPLSAKPAAVSAGNRTSAVTSSGPATKTAPAKASSATASSVTAKPVVHAKSEAKSSTTAETKDPFSSHAKSHAVQVKTVSAAQEKPAAQASSSGASAVVARKIGAAGRRDPFVSPVVSIGVVGSGCSSGKRCLDIEQIALRGVVRSETGMIAVVVNALDKAYFLRENDPVFNGFVEKITANSIVFKQTFHDKLGKPLTRDVTKTISRPAA
ncbi:MAG: hypothetical protein JO356_12655 [Acidobacteria bacterium]|nr:hypothetical protein [Acidobacteriota bacterium]